MYLLNGNTLKNNKYMKIWKYVLLAEKTQLVKMPLKSEIIDIQMLDRVPIMWAIVDPDTEEIEVRINIYGTGDKVQGEHLKEEYLATVQDGAHVWHFFRYYETDKVEVKKLTAVRTNAKDIDSVNVEVFNKDTLIAKGHYNIRTNCAHVTVLEGYQELQDAVIEGIENRTIELS